MEEKVNVLVVDDESYWRDNYESSVRELGVDSIHTTDNLVDARQLIDDMKFAAAIIDIGLDTSDETNVDGLLVMEKLRSVNDETSIVVITGRSGSDVIDVVSKSIREYSAIATFAKGKVDPVLLKDAVTKGLQVHAAKMARKHRPVQREIPHQHSQMVWEDLMMRTLGISEGITFLYDFLEKLLRAYLPLVGAVEDSSLGADLTDGVVHGAYWSRSIGRPVLVSLGTRAAIDKALGAASTGMLYGRYEIGEIILSDCLTPKVRGTVHELRNYSRPQFNGPHGGQV